MTIKSGTTLRQWRKNRGLTQDDVAAIAGIHRGSVSNYEHDVNPVPETLSVLLEKHDQKVATKTVKEQLSSKGTLTGMGLMYWRTINNVSKTALASMLGVSVKTISKYEKDIDEALPAQVKNTLVASDNHSAAA